MSILCKNCGNVFEGNFCNNCGQAANTHSINTAFIAHDIQHGLLHYDGGLLYSAKKLFTKPGYTISDYIQGKRIKHYKPISMVIVVASLYGLLYHLLGINAFEGQESDIFDYEKFNEWMGHNYGFVVLATIPLYAISSYIVFKKQGYNFTEHIILNAFCSTQRLWIRIATLPLLLIADDTAGINLILRLLLLADLLLMFWTYSQFFDTLSKLKLILKILVWQALFYVLFTVLFTIIVLLYNRL